MIRAPFSLLERIVGIVRKVMYNEKIAVLII